MNSIVLRYLRQVRLLRQLRSQWIWNRREKAFSNFLKRLSWQTPEPCVNGCTIVVIQPWLETPLPWFMLTLAAGISQRGRRVMLVWDDTGFGIETSIQRNLQASIGRILGNLPKAVERVRLSKIPPANEEALSEKSIKRLVELNTVQHFRSEELPPESASYQISVDQKLRQASAHVKALLKQYRPAYMIVGGGIYSSSGIFLHLGQLLKIRVASIDSGPGVMLACTDGIAAYLDDIPAALRILPEDDKWMIDEARNELARRRRGQDAFSYQLVEASGYAEPLGVLLPLNQSFDTAALGRHLVFRSQTEWMLETVAWVLENTRETIAVRRHPVEHIEGYTSKDNYRSLLLARFGRDARLKYIPQDMLINTYDLIQQARVVAPYVSTVGVEAAAMGKPVVTEGASYYADLGFVWCGKSRKEYFGLLSRAIKGQLEVSDAQRHSAWRCYYLTQCCNFLRTSFTPQHTDFDEWVNRTPEEIMSSDEISDLLESLDTAVPMSIVRHIRRKRLREATKLENDQETHINSNI